MRKIARNNKSHESHWTHDRGISLCSTKPENTPDVLLHPFTSWNFQLARPFFPHPFAVIEPPTGIDTKIFKEPSPKPNAWNKIKTSCSIGESQYTTQTKWWPLFSELDVVAGEDSLACADHARPAIYVSHHVGCWLCTSKVPRIGDTYHQSLSLSVFLRIVMTSPFLNPRSPG